MRIAIGQLWQETNTFNPLPTTRADFEAFGVLRGAELVERIGGADPRRWRCRAQTPGKS